MRRPIALVGHILFLDLVRSSNLSIEQFGRATSDFRELVMSTREFREYAKLGRVQIEDTGDGLALAFLDDPTSPAECLAEIRIALESRPPPLFRAAVHSGPMIRVDGLAGRKFTGAAFAEAKAVMDACAPGQVLASWEAARTLSHFERWKPCLGEERTVVGKGGDSRNVLDFDLSRATECEPIDWSALTAQRARRPVFIWFALAAMVVAGFAVLPFHGAQPSSASRPARTAFDGHFSAVDLGPAHGYESVYLNNRGQVVVGVAASPGIPSAYVIDASTGRRTDLGRQLYVPEIADTGRICGLWGQKIVSIAAPDARAEVDTVLPHEVAHGGTDIDHVGSRIFFYNDQGGVAGRWSMWDPRTRQVNDSLNPNLDDAFINSRDHVVGKMGASVVTYNNEIYTTITNTGVPAGIADSGDILVYDRRTNATAIFDFSGKRLASIPNFDVTEGKNGGRCISSAADERVIGMTPNGWEIYDLTSGRLLPINVPGWRIRWVASMNSKNEMIAAASSSGGGLRFLLLRPSNPRSEPTR